MLTWFLFPVPPTIEKIENQINAEANKIVTLKCMTSGEPKPRVSWYFNDEPIHANKDYNFYRDNSIRYVKELE